MNKEAERRRLFVLNPLRLRSRMLKQTLSEAQTLTGEPHADRRRVTRIIERSARRARKWAKAKVSVADGRATSSWRATSDDSRRDERHSPLTPWYLFQFSLARRHLLIDEFWLEHEISAHEDAFGALESSLGFAAASLGSEKAKKNHDE
jgi:hypothetical protein